MRGNIYYAYERRNTYICTYAINMNMKKMWHYEFEYEALEQRRGRCAKGGDVDAGVMLAEYRSAAALLVVWDLYFFIYYFLSTFRFIFIYFFTFFLFCGRLAD